MHAISNFDTMKDEPYNVGLSDANLSKLELCAKIKGLVHDFVYLESPVGEDLIKGITLFPTKRLKIPDFNPRIRWKLVLKSLSKDIE